MTHAPKPEFAGRPLTSLHQGHVALLCTSGMMNGCFGEGKDRHVAYWESVKVVDRREEEEDGVTVIHERERFSQRLTLLYADGRIALFRRSLRGAFQKGRSAMQNAHLRMGKLTFVRQTRDTITNITVGPELPCG